MSDSDISFETDDEGLCDKVHRDIESLLPSRWTDVNADDIEISARNIYSCVSSNGLLTTLEQRPSNTQPSKHSEENKIRENSKAKGKCQSQNSTNFIQKNFNNMDMGELLAVKEDLMNESLNHRDHLKRFMKENFQSCINNMDTIREVSMRLQAASLEGGVGVHGATPAKVLEELKMTDSVAQGSFSGLIKRFSLSQNLDSVLQLLGKYDSLVILPSMVRSSIEARDFEAVVMLYQKAMGLVRRDSISTGDIQTIWKRLQSEVFKAMESAVTILEATLHNSKVTMGESLEAACYLEKLKILGVPAAADKKSVDAFFEFQVSSVIVSMKKMREYSKSLDRVQNRSCSESQSRNPRVDQSSGSTKLAKSHEKFCVQTLTADFYEWCYEIWGLFKSPNSSNASILNSHDKNVAKNTVIERAFSAYSDLIESCISSICLSHTDIKESEEIIEFLIDTHLEQEEDMSTVLLPLCKDLVIHSCQQIILGFESHLRMHAQSVLLVNGNCMSGFIPQKNAIHLHESLDEYLSCISKISKHAARIKVKVPVASYPVNSLLKLVSEVCSASILKLASRKPVLSMDGEEVDEYILFIAWNTLEEIKTCVLPQLVTKWSFLLNSGGTTPKENAQAFKWCCRQIEESQEYLIRSWVEIKLEKLEPTMETLLTMEEAERGHEHEEALVELCMAKPCLWELLTALKCYDADLQLSIPVLREEVTGELYLAIVEGIQNLFLSDHYRNSDLQSKAQLWLDLSVFQSWLNNVEKSENRTDMESRTLAQTVLSQIEENVRSQIQKVPGSPSVGVVKKWIARICDRDLSSNL